MIYIVRKNHSSAYLFLIFIATVTIWDLINRSTDMYAHYSDNGVMPRHVVLTSYWNDSWFSYYMIR